MRNNPKIQRKSITWRAGETGQAIVLVAFALVAVLGMAALVIDGGRLFADKRQAQNTADAASFAGGLVIAQADKGNPLNLPGGTMAFAESKAYDRAQSNSYGPGDPDVDITVDVVGPLFDNGLFYYEVRVEITSRIDGMLTPIVYQGQLTSTVYSVARVMPIQGLCYGNSLCATAANECDALVIRGTLDLDIVGGSIFSNSDAPSMNCPSLHLDVDEELDLTDGGIGAVGYILISGSGSIPFIPVTGIQPQTLAEVPSPDCTGLHDHGDRNDVIAAGDTKKMHPATYGSITVTGGKLTMEPGLYCILNGFSATGGTIFAKGVIISVEKGDFSVSENTKIFLSAPTGYTDKVGNYWGGMMLYMGNGNPGTISLSGTVGSSYTGTVFAPGPASPSYKPRCSIVAIGHKLTVDSQIICYSIDVNGDGWLRILYKPNSNFKLGSRMSMQE